MGTKIMTAAEIRAALAARMLTRVQLAKKMGVSYDYVCKLLNGRRHSEMRYRQITEIMRDRGVAWDEPEMRGIA